MNAEQRVKKLSEAVSKKPAKKQEPNLCPECGLTYKQCECDDYDMDMDSEATESPKEKKAEKKKGMFVSTQPLLNIMISTAASKKGSK